VGGQLKAILLSGGIESTAIAYWLRPDFAITVDYGQPSFAGEMQAAKTIASVLSIPHECVSVSPYPPRTPTPRPPTESHSIWWPYRNQLLVTLAAIALAERGVSDIYVGLVKGDIFKDCTPAFVDTLNRLLAMQERPVKVVAPARRLSTLELLKKSEIPYEMLGATTSCHVGVLPCGRCAGCTKAAKAKWEYKQLTA
jgi:7-cyano-7-deazaguanine synthase